jgi:eukaryotic-like serine/threonine-protein kinase
VHRWRFLPASGSRTWVATGSRDGVTVVYQRCWKHGSYNLAYPSFEGWVVYSALDSKTARMVEMSEDRTLRRAVAGESPGDRRASGTDDGDARRAVGGERLGLPEVLAGRYRLGERLGAGAFGVVYRAVDERIRRDVAVKVLGIADARAIQRFRNEALAAGKLQHPNIVAVTDFATLEDGRPFLVMEHVRGETLAARLERLGRLPIGEAARIAHTLAVALETAHGKRIIHRDLKPGNVMLGEVDGGGLETIKILDFGIAKLIEDWDSTLTAPGQILGTPAYMAPEQARNQEQIDGRADVYAVGVLLYEALTGNLPFGSKHVLDLLLLKVTEDPKPPSQWVSDLPPELEEVVLKALRRDRTERFSTAADLALALQPHVSAEGRAALRPSRARTRAVLLGGTFLGLVAGVATWSMVGQPSPQTATAPKASAKSVPASAEVTSPPVPIPSDRKTSSAQAAEPPPQIRRNRPARKKTTPPAPDLLDMPVPVRLPK